MITIIFLVPKENQEQEVASIQKPPAKKRG